MTRCRGIRASCRKLAFFARHGQQFRSSSLGCLLLLVAACLLQTYLVPLAANLQADEPPRKVDVSREIVPLAKRYCLSCHGPDKQRGGVALHQAGTAAELLAQRGTWESALELIELEAMPPEDAPQPSAEERAALVRALEHVLFYVDCDQPRDPGRVTIRRLNRNEYNNTVRDLLGVTLRPADNFPSDDVGEGFDNIGDVLSLPPLLLEKYLDAAETLATTAVIDVASLQPSRTNLQRDQLRSQGGVRLDDYGVYALFSRGEVTGTFQFPRDGTYRLRVEAGAQQAGDEAARVELRLDGKQVKTFDVKARPDAMEFYEVSLRVEAGRKTLTGEFINDYYNPTAAKPQDRDRNLFIRSLEVVGPTDARPEELPPSHRNLVRHVPGKERSVTEAATLVLRPLMQRAFRRPARPGEVERFVRLVELAVKRGDSFERGLQVAIAGILVSPHFLFRVETAGGAGEANEAAEADEAGEADGQASRLNDFELASRLSYFLWSSMPDDELFTLASQGRLHRDDVLRQQVRRMLASDKARALVENFGGQWLNLRSLDELTPDPNRFPEFDAALRTAMQQETLLFFEAVMREDRSLLDFLRGDFTFVNGRLARHYGLEQAAGEEFQRVLLDPRQRRGILTHASILTLTSNPTRTSPVKRGKWILENILGTPPPEPPANVPELDVAQKAAPSASLRQQLELHRRDPGCAVCHTKMDALGFGLENFDAIGRWRDQEAGRPIDASGELPGDKRFEGPGQLAELLATQRTEFARAVTRKLLTYALGRGLQYYDRCAVDKIVEQLEQNDYRFSVLITEIVKSEPFRLRGEQGESP